MYLHYGNLTDLNLKLLCKNKFQNLRYLNKGNQVVLNSTSSIVINCYRKLLQHMEHKVPSGKFSRLKQKIKNNNTTDGFFEWTTNGEFYLIFTWILANYQCKSLLVSWMNWQQVLQASFLAQISGKNADTNKTKQMLDTVKRSLFYYNKKLQKKG